MCQLAYYSGHNFIYQTSLNDTRSQIVACLETGHTEIGTAAYKRYLLSLALRAEHLAFGSTLRIHSFYIKIQEKNDNKRINPHSAT